MAESTDEVLAQVQSRGDIESLARLEAAVLAGYQASVDRARSSATTTITAASAIAVIYSGLLALMPPSPHAFPLLGLVPAVYLGVAILNSISFLNYSSGGRGQRASSVVVKSAVGLQARTFARIDAFGRWITEYLTLRAPFLASAVIALVVGVVAMPLPFLKGSEPGEVAWPTADSSLPIELRTLKFERELDLAAQEAAEPTALLDEGAQTWALSIGAGGAVALAVVPYCIAANRKRRN